MPGYLRNIAAIFTEAALGWMRHQSTQAGAALAFFGVLSLAPLLVTTLAIASVLIGKQQSANEHLVSRLSELVGHESAQAIRDLLSHAPHPTSDAIATGISVLALLWGAAGVFSSLQAAFITIWETPPAEVPATIGAFAVGQFLSLVMVLGVGVLLVLSLIFSALLSGLGQFFESPGIIPLLRAVDACATPTLVAALFAMIFKLLPPVRIAWRDVALGAWITAILFTIGKLAIATYLGVSGLASAYGAAGSLVVLVVWTYYSSQILLFGAELTRAFAQHFGSQQPHPALVQPAPAPERLGAPKGSLGG